MQRDRSSSRLTSASESTLSSMSSGRSSPAMRHRGRGGPVLINWIEQLLADRTQRNRMIRARRLAMTRGSRRRIGTAVERAEPRPSNTSWRPTPWE